MRRRLCRPWRPYWELASRDSLHFDSPTPKRPRGLSKLPYCARRFAWSHKRNPDCGFAKRQFPWALLAPWPLLLAQSQHLSEDRPNRSELDENSGSTSVTSVGFGNSPMKVTLAREHPPSQRLRGRTARAMMTRMDRCHHAGYSTLLKMIPCYLIETDSNGCIAFMRGRLMVDQWRRKTITNTVDDPMSDTKKLLVGSCALFVLCVALALLNALGLASPSLLFYGWLLAAAGGALLLYFAIARALRERRK